MRSRTVRETTISPSPATAIDAGREVHGHARDVVVVRNLDTPGMETDAERDAHLAQLGPQLDRAFHRGRRIGEHRQDAVARRLDQAAPIGVDRVVGDRPVHTDHRVHARSPRDSAISVDRTMSLNRIVANCGRRRARVVADEGANVAEDEVGGLPVHRAIATGKLDELRPARRGPRDSDHETPESTRSRRGA